MSKLRKEELADYKNIAIELVKNNLSMYFLGRNENHEIIKVLISHKHSLRGFAVKCRLEEVSNQGIINLSRILIKLYVNYHIEF